MLQAGFSANAENKRLTLFSPVKSQYSYTTKLACNARQTYLDGNKSMDTASAVKSHENSEVKLPNPIASALLLICIRMHTLLTNNIYKL